MFKLINKTVSFIICCFFIFTSNAFSMSLNKSIWTQEPEGWHFYKEKKHKYIEPEEQKKKDKDQEELFSERMRKKGEELLSKAMENPTIENVYNYAKHNKEMIDRSQRFADMWQFVLALYPELSYPDKPAHPRFRLQEYKLEDQITYNSLLSLSQKAGLFFIYSTSCPYCYEQAKDIKKFTQEYPFFTVKAVSVDGGIFPEFPDTLIDQGFTYRIGIKSVPALVLYFPQKDGFLKVSEGAIDLTTLKRRLILYEKLYDQQNLDSYFTYYNN